MVWLQGCTLGYATTKISNPNASSTQLANGAAEGAITGFFVGGTTGGFSGAIGKGAGIAGELVSGMLGLGVGASSSAINTHYNIFDNNSSVDKIKPVPDYKYNILQPSAPFVPQVPKIGGQPSLIKVF